MPKMVNFGEFLKLEACGQTVLPDRSLLIGTKLVENGKIQKFKCDILSDKGFIKLPKMVNFGEFLKQKK